MLDLETTGLDISKDRIIEIALIKRDPDGTESEFCRRINPTIPISPESSEITGITDEMVQNEPTFAELADEIITFIGNADLGGYNSNKFDIPVLAEEFLRAEKLFDFSVRKCIDVQNIFHKMEQRTLAAAYLFYCNGNMENAHNALYDTRVTFDVFKAQLDRYPELADNVAELAEFSRQGNVEWADFAGRVAKNKDGKLIYNFGKHKGKTVEEVSNIEPGYFGWMMDADFPLFTKQVLREEMERIKLARRQQRDSNTENLSMEDKLKALQNKFKH
jgi:DNA polymerase-3 subunit epsilon